jgi:hypothetical protein
MGSIYYAGIGIGSKSKKIDSYRSYILLMNEYRVALPELNKKDNFWLDYQISLYEYKINSTLLNYIKLCKDFYRCFEFKYGIKFIFTELSNTLIYSLKLFYVKQNKL